MFNEHSVRHLKLHIEVLLLVVGTESVCQQKDCTGRLSSRALQVSLAQSCPLHERDALLIQLLYKSEPHTDCCTDFRSVQC